MTNQESVRALPGGACKGLADNADKVYKADLGGIETLKATLSTAASNFSDNVQGKLDPAVHGLDEAWQGESADQFVAYMTKFKTAGTQVQQALTDAAGDIEAAHGVLDEGRTNLETLFSNLLKDVDEQTPSAEQTEEGGETLSDVCNRVAGTYAPQVTSQINDVNTALGNVVATLKGRVGEIAAGFSTIPAANDQVFVPGPAHKVEWVPTPESESQTAPSGTQDGTETGGSNNGGSNSGGSNSGGSDSGGGASNVGGPGATSAGGGDGPSGPPPTAMPPGNVDEWIKEAIKVLQAHGVNVTEADIPTIWAIIQHESGGNPNAINNWDSNAAAGHPSKGLMQCIDSTFNAYKMPGYDNIYGPVDNICAGVNYAISRYGSLSNVPGIASMAGGGGYKGY